MELLSQFNLGGSEGATEWSHGSRHAA